MVIRLRTRPRLLTRAGQCRRADELYSGVQLATDRAECGADAARQGSHRGCGAQGDHCGHERVLDKILARFIAQKIGESVLEVSHGLLLDAGLYKRLSLTIRIFDRGPGKVNTSFPGAQTIALT